VAQEPTYVSGQWSVVAMKILEAEIGRIVERIELIEDRRLDNDDRGALDAYRAIQVALINLRRPIDSSIPTYAERPSRKPSVCGTCNGDALGDPNTRRAICGCKRETAGDLRVHAVKERARAAELRRQACNGQLECLALAEACEARAIELETIAATL